MAENAISENVPAECGHEDWTMNDAIQYVISYLKKEHPEITDMIGDNGWRGHFGRVQGYARQALGADHKMDWYVFAHMEKTLNTFAKSGTGKSVSCPKGKQHFSGHDDNDMAKAYVELVGGNKELVPDKSEKGTIKREQAREAEAKAKHDEIVASRIAQVSKIMGEVFSAENFQQAIQGKTKEVVAIMNGFDQQTYDKFVSAMDEIVAEFGVYADYIGLIMSVIPTSPEHMYTEEELAAIPALTAVMSALKAQDKEYQQAFAIEEAETE